MQNLFPKVHYRRRRGAGGDARPGESRPYTSQEIDRVRRELLSNGTSAACPRCGETLQSRTPVHRSGTGAVVWPARCPECKRDINVRAMPVGSSQAPDFRDLVVSNPSRDRMTAAPRWVFSAGVHAVLIAGAAFATQQRGADADIATADTTRVLLLQQQRPEPQRETPPEAPRPQLLAVVAPPPLPKGFQTITAPVEVPVEIPPVDAARRFDPRDFTGVGVEGGVWDGWEGVSEAGDGDSDAPLPAGVVDEPPRALSSPKLRFPEALRAAGIQGFVVVGFVVDTTGRAERGSIRIVASTHPGFDASAKETIRKSRYRPGRMRGKPVRTLATQRVDFNILGLGRN
jgi:protein TonB